MFKKGLYHINSWDISLKEFIRSLNTYKWIKTPEGHQWNTHNDWVKLVRFWQDAHKKEG